MVTCFCVRWDLRKFLFFQGHFMLKVILTVLWRYIFLQKVKITTWIVRFLNLNRFCLLLVVPHKPSLISHTNYPPNLQLYLHAIKCNKKKKNNAVCWKCAIAFVGHSFVTCIIFSISLMTSSAVATWSLSCVWTLDTIKECMSNCWASSSSSERSKLGDSCSWNITKVIHNLQTGTYLTKDSDEFSHWFLTLNAMKDYNYIALQINLTVLLGYCPIIISMTCSHATIKVPFKCKWRYLQKTFYGIYLLCLLTLGQKLVSLLLVRILFG